MNPAQTFWMELLHGAILLAQFVLGVLQIVMLLRQKKIEISMNGTLDKLLEAHREIGRHEGRKRAKK